MEMQGVEPNTDQMGFCDEWNKKYALFFLDSPISACSLLPVSNASLSLSSAPASPWSPCMKSNLKYISSFNWFTWKQKPGTLCYKPSLLLVVPPRRPCRFLFRIASFYLFQSSVFSFPLFCAYSIGTKYTSLPLLLVSVSLQSYSTLSYSSETRPFLPSRSNPTTHLLATPCPSCHFYDFSVHKIWRQKQRQKDLSESCWKDDSRAWFLHDLSPRVSDQFRESIVAINNGILDNLSIGQNKRRVWN